MVHHILNSFMKEISFFIWVNVFFWRTMANTDQVTKTWHDSQFIREKTKFLLEHLDEIPADVVFRVGAGENVRDIPCHRLILALGSSVFKAMLYGDIGERSAVINIPDITPDIFQVLIRFLYSEEVVDLTTENVLDCIYAAKKYLIIHLLEHCRSFIRDKLTPDLACRVFEKASLLDEDKLGRLAAIDISSDPAPCLASSTFLRLPEDKVRQLLLRDDLRVPENDIYQAARKWATAPTGGSMNSGNSSWKGKLRRLLDTVRVPLMSPSEIVNGPDKDGVLTGYTELAQIYRHKFADKDAEKPKLRFLTVPRTPRPESFYVSLQLRMICRITSAMSLPITGSITLHVYRDVAPVTSQAFLTELPSISSLSFGRLHFSMKPDVGPVSHTLNVSVPVDVAGHVLPEEEPNLLPRTPFMVALVKSPTEPGAVKLVVAHPTERSPQLDDDDDRGHVFALVVEGMEFLQRLHIVHDALTRDWEPAKGNLQLGFRKRFHTFEFAFSFFKFYRYNLATLSQVIGGTT